MKESELLQIAFSHQRMSRYFALYPNNEARAILHYKQNIRLAESLYTSLSVFEVTLRNALSRQMQKMVGRDDWYVIFDSNPQFKDLQNYILQASRLIISRGETIEPNKIISELAFGFWTSLLNSQYERELWKSLRLAFPYLSKQNRKRKVVSAPCNKFRKLRNRVFHHEAICWDLTYVESIHREICEVLGWINPEIVSWLSTIDQFDSACISIRHEMNWE